MDYDTIILGAGAAGLFCAGSIAGQRVLVLDHAKAPGEKVRISGGGRCNFTNIHAEPANFLSQNPHFCKSALSRFRPWDFVALVDAAGIAWHEKTLGQLFCDGSARQIVTMLMRRAKAAGAEVRLQTRIGAVCRGADGFTIAVEGHGPALRCRNLVLATGGKSIPKMGASGLSYRLAAQFGLKLTETRPALVPLTFPPERFAGLAGVALPVRAEAGGAAFEEAMLFTHRGLSGPAILQVSSYWHEGEPVTVDLAPGRDLAADLRAARYTSGGIGLRRALRAYLPARLADHLSTELDPSGNLADQSDKALEALASALQNWKLMPAGSEGYRTAEVTLGGIDTGGLSSKTMEAKRCPGLYAIGEALDVTGWLGGYNFQWAWASGDAAGRAVSAR